MEDERELETYLIPAIGCKFDSVVWYKLVDIAVLVSF